MLLYFRMVSIRMLYEYTKFKDKTVLHTHLVEYFARHAY